MPILNGRFKSSPKFKNVTFHPIVNVIHDPPEWKYVEELLGKRLVPIPTPKEEYPSGWKPQDPEKYSILPYYIKRTKNHMLPVYLTITYRGHRRVTIIKNIEGDIWEFEREVNELIRSKTNNKPCYTQINEMARFVRIKGDYMTLIQKYLYSKGL